jgi:hypothetical protein
VGRVALVNDTVTIDGQEVPKPDNITYDIASGETCLRYQGTPDLITIGPGGGGAETEICGAGGANPAPLARLV